MKRRIRLRWWWAVVAVVGVGLVLIFSGQRGGMARRIPVAPGPTPNPPRGTGLRQSGLGFVFQPPARGRAVAEPTVGAAAAARVFLAGYLRLGCDRGSAVDVHPVVAALRRRLVADRVPVAPVTCHHRTEIRGFELVQIAPGFIAGTSVVEEAGVEYRLGLTMGRPHGRWVVTTVHPG